MNEREVGQNKRDRVQLSERFSEAYAPFLQRLQSTAGAVLLAADTTGLRPTIDKSRFEELCAKYSDAPYAEILEHLLIVGTNRMSEYIIDPEWSFDATTAGAAIIEAIRSSYIPVASMSEMKDLDYLVIENVANNDAITSYNALQPREREMIEFASVAGIIRKDGRVAQRSITREQIQSALTITALIHNSESIPGITEGWSHVVVRKDRYHEIVGKNGHTELEKMGYIHASQLTDGSEVEGIVFVNCVPMSRRHTKKEYLMPKVRNLNRRESRISGAEAILRQAIEDVIEHGDVLPIQDLPQSIRVATYEEIMKRLTAAGIDDIRRVSKTGYIHPAHIVNEKGAPVSDIYTNVKDGGRFRSYFMADNPEVLEQWKKSKKYDEWMAGDRLTQFWQEQWNVIVQEYALSPAGFVPRDCQPAYLVPESAIHKAKAAFPHIGRENALRAQANGGKNYEVVWMFFPDSKNAARYKRYLAAGGNETPFEQTVAREAAMIQWLVSQVTLTPEWLRLQTVEDSGENIRMANLAELRELLVRFPPLQSDALKKRGFLIDAQHFISRINKGRPQGKLIICPGGKGQSERIKKTDWYQKMVSSQ